MGWLEGVCGIADLRVLRRWLRFQGCLRREVSVIGVIVSGRGEEVTMGLGVAAGVGSARRVGGGVWVMCSAPLLWRLRH